MVRYPSSVVAALVITGIALANIFIMRQYINNSSREVVYSDSGTGQSAVTLKLQRNLLSQILNDVKRELSMMSCGMIELQATLKMNTSKVSATGGWCKKTSYNNSGQHAFDQSLAKELSILFTNKRVASFGDGPGSYKRYIDKTGLVSVYDAYDGAPYGPETSGGVVKFLDLTAPQFGLPVYDWVISLEVAEHIPPKYEPVYIDNIVRHAGSGLVISWARPGQGGLAHVNNRPLEYVQQLLSDKGFDIDMEGSKILQSKASLSWLKHNVFVYRRREGNFALSEFA